MGITVTANPAGTPPNFGIAISSSNGSAITGVSLIATANGLTVPTRVQPSPGPSPRLVTDYEAAWDSNVVYTATVTSSAGTETFTAAAAVISPTVPWLIHPTTPALSRPLDQGVQTAMGVAALGPISRAATTTGHDILGSKYRVITKTGPRGASRLSMQVRTVTTLEQQALFALVDDQTPILIRVPAAWAWDWEDGYYDIGEVSAERFIAYGANPMRTFTLPLERVEAPAGTQQATRTWADVLAQNASWSAISAGYATWTDLLTNTRR